MRVRIHACMHVPVRCNCLKGVSGVVGPVTNWRVPFVVVAAPAILCTVLMRVTTSDPPRGAYEDALRMR